MSLSKRLCTGVLVVFLSACGFQPLYKAEGTRLSHDNITIASIPDRDGVYLRNVLIDRLYTHGYPAEAPYLLQIDPLQKDVLGMGIQKDATATRNQMTISSRMRLVEKQTGKIVLEREIRAVGGYNVLDNQFATLVSEQNLTERILRELMETVVMNIDLYFKQKTTP